MPKDNAHLADILMAAKAMRRFTIEIIGEASRHLSAEGKRHFPDVPWKLITAMRSILIHDYDDVDLNVVWDTIQE